MECSVSILRGTLSSFFLFFLRCARKLQFANHCHIRLKAACVFPQCIVETRVKRLFIPSSHLQFGRCNLGLKLQHCRVFHLVRLAFTLPFVARSKWLLVSWTEYRRESGRHFSQKSNFIPVSMSLSKTRSNI